MTWLWRHWHHSQQWQQVNNIIAFWNLYAKLCFGHVLICSLSAYLMQVKLLLVTFYLNDRLHAISVGKPSEWMSNFWTVQFFKNQIQTKFRFSAHPHWKQGITVFVGHLHTTLFITMLSTSQYLTDEAKKMLNTVSINSSTLLVLDLINNHSDNTTLYKWLQHGKSHY